MIFDTIASKYSDLWSILAMFHENTLRTCSYCIHNDVLYEPTIKILGQNLGKRSISTDSRGTPITPKMQMHVNEPTGRPTNQPTDRPSNRPTKQPTHRPTKQPTDQPANQPINQSIKQTKTEPSND